MRPFWPTTIRHRLVLAFASVLLAALTEAFAREVANWAKLSGIQLMRTVTGMAPNQNLAEKVPMLGTEYEFGPQRAHASNRANLPVQLQQGRWIVAHWDYIVVPRAGP